MKKWIHASSDEDSDWKKEWGSDLGESYYIREKNGLKAVISYKDNDGDWYYWVRVFKPGQSGMLADKTIYSLESAKEWADTYLDDKSAVKSSKQIKASDDYMEENLSYDEVYDDFMDIENEVAAELGWYVDWSSIRGDNGTIFIFSDPDQECDSDMWDGDWDALITELDFSDYKYGVETNVLAYPEEEWKARYKKYVESLV